MSMRVDLDLTEFLNTLDATPEAIHNGSVTAVQDILNDWQKESRNDAPIDTGELRRRIETTLEAEMGSDIQGIIENNVYNGSFNYAYWQHNVRGGDGLKYIENNEKPTEWERQITEEIEKETKKAGW